ncbi:hypothetical protein APHAL10511_001109 [Amanita phalloides]|nr:hypothetical protein APHAL10511_001109 [Amanita phalloides]
MPPVHDQHPSSDVDESQATQLIQNVLAAPDPSAPSSGAGHWNKPDDSVVVNESSADSSSIGCSTRTLSHYHLHGLAQTQDDVLNEGSQKENINGGGRSDIRDAAVDRSTKITRTKGRRQDQLDLSHYRTKEARSRPKLDESLKNTSFHYVSSMQSNFRNSKPLSRQRSPSELSQDSFAGDTIDPEQHFLSSARQFQVPLSELARPSSSGQRASAEDNSNSSMRRPSDTYGQNRHHDEQKDGDTITVDETNSQNSVASSSGPGSSMYERRDEEGTQNDIQATQPTTPSDKGEPNGSGGSDPPWLLAAARASVTSIAGNSPTPPSATNPDHVKSNSSGGRSLLSMIHPKNKWRFQKYQHISDPRSSGPRDSDVAVPGMSSIQGAQLYLGDGLALSFQREFQRPSSDLPSFPDQPEQRRAGTLKDPMDEVPDSEPSREEPSPVVLDSGTGDKAIRQSRMPQGIVQQKNPTPVTRTNRQDDDSDDDSDDIDVPLAKVSTLFARKGKEREPDQAQKLVSRLTRPRSRVQESAEIPSSVPEQDVAPPIRDLRSVKNDEKAKKTGENATKKIEKAHAGPSRRIVRKIEYEKVEESKSESEQMQKTEGEESDEMEDEDYQDPEAQASSKKRKRGAAPAKAPVTHRKGPITRTTVGTAKMAARKQTKRPRSATASIIKMTNMEPTRVFALWRQDGHFYSGTVHMLQPDNRFRVKFDDETEAVVSLEQMRLCELRAGDDVLLPNRTRSSKVIRFSKAGDKVVTVETDEDAEDVEMKSLRIASRTIKSAWKDRHVTVENVVPEVQPIKVGGSPAPSGISLASAQSNKSMRRKFLSKIGFVVSLSAGNANWERDKELLISTIRNNGGVVLDDWSSVVRMEGKHTHHNNRWVLDRDEVQWGGKDVERVFLLADDSSQKPKFLMAIGLGIPCLSMNWLHDSISAGEEKEWSAYMLPQGYSDRLSARISQQVDVDWGNSVHQLTDIMDNAVPAKIFSNQSILCVGTDMVPQPRGKRNAGTDEKTQETSNAVARIIMCMGAHRVEAVAELRYASFDIEGGTVVTWSWVKDCLIASRRLPLEDMISQEA